MVIAEEEIPVCLKCAHKLLESSRVKSPYVVIICQEVAKEDPKLSFGCL